jgi:hypothetical protein
MSSRGLSWHIRCFYLVIMTTIDPDQLETVTGGISQTMISNLLVLEQFIQMMQSPGVSDVMNGLGTMLSNAQPQYMFPFAPSS